MLELIEEEKYPGGTALGVYKPGDARIVADGFSLLEELAPSDLSHVQRIIAPEQGSGTL